MRTEEIEKEIGGFFRNEGIPIYGIAAVRQLQAARKNFSPQGLLKGAKSIICYGIPIPKGIIYANNDDLTLYWRYCNTQYRALDSSSNRLCLFLEERNCLATPIYSCFPWKVVNRRFLGHLPLVYWAEEAGLGRVSKCGLLVTPLYGTRILLGGAVTTQKLKPDEKLNKECCPLDCFDCVNVCPTKAIKRTGEVDHNLCIRYSSSNPLLALVLDSQTIRKKYSFAKLLNTVAVDDHGVYSCFECLRACPLNKR